MKYLQYLSTAAMGLAFALCLAQRVDAASHSGESAKVRKLYPVADYARRADYAGAVLSPNGQHLAVLVPLNGRSNLAVIDLSTRASKVLTSIDRFDVQNPVWVGNERLIFSLGENDTPTGPGVFEGGGLLMVSRDGTESRVLEPTIREARAAGQRSVRRTQLMAGIPANDKEVIIAEYGRTSDGADVYRLDITTGRRTLQTATRPERVDSYVLDRNLIARVAMSTVKNELTRIVWHRDSEEAPWKELTRLTGVAGEQTSGAEKFIPLAFDSDNKTLLVASNRGRNTTAIRKYDAEKKSLGDVVASHPRYDMGADADGNVVPGLVLRASTRDVIGYAVDAEQLQVVWTDDRLARIQATIDKSFVGRVNRLQATNSDRVLITSYSDTQPQTFWLYDDKAKSLEQVVSSMSWIKPDHLVEVRPFLLKTRDGLEIPSYYLLPRDHKAGDKLPTVLHIHGGPHARADHWGALWQGGFGVAEAQLLASRGYAVVLPNFRITPGLGKDIYMAGRASIGRQMSEDHEDAVKWAVDQGFADPKRICMSGASYGGYATLRALAKTPDMFRCGVAGLSVSDIDLQLTSTAGDTAYSTEGQTFWREFIVGEDKAPGSARKVSPVHQAAQIKSPLLLYAGAADIRTPIEQTNRMVSALRSAGQNPEVLIKAEEGHGFGKLDNRVELWERMLDFLDRQIGSKGR
jgi:dipeptidyl aminopeptidase/acylaminoacyl peptidase